MHTGDTLILTAHQPAYLPWLGFFHKIAIADLFCYFDIAQYQSRDFNNRNKIKTYEGELWLTVPVESKNHFSKKVGEIIIPSIPVDIKQNNHVISQIETNKITLNILSNISSTSNEMRSIKPIKELKLISPFKIALLLLSLVAGIVVAGYLWKTKTRQSKSKYLTGSFKISALKESVKKIEDLPLPEIINSESTEKYYLKLSEICRLFFKEVFYIKATEMTSGELAEHFKLIGIEPELVNSWNDVCQIVDMAKYASHIPPIDQFTEDKKDYIKLITSFYKIQSQSGVNKKYSKIA